MIFHYRGKVDSTNTWAKDIHIDNNLHVLYAGYQTSGRGRQTRKWLSSPYKNILMSVTHKHINNDFEPWFYGISAAYSIIKVMEEYRIEAYYKWPNDVWTTRGKICGILPEAIWSNGNIEKIIVGIGLNVNEELFPANIIATSMYIETGRQFDIHTLLRKVSNYYKESLETNKEHILEFLWQHFLWKDKIIILLPDNITGKAIGLNHDGSLIVCTKKQCITAKWGEVSIRKI
ncbi:biotin--[acetyl-CoA-carboxylase] ligase [bacterium 3DAC]|jgi:BirA family biotin operon repressor/biotin-[acetyl-CoA-carboxylase] ligase|nr:biotin--[acetyl-CoA-carboxylase] ligase [Dictyoglomota bacterium]UZN22919.1 biotin--[acetyl-CoA-carboxylase] ligase [bacterium 3DAC]